LHIVPRLPGVMPRLFADKRALKQMLLNLLSNTAKFAPTDGAVCISARLEDNGGGAIAVTDSGIGVAKGDMQKVMTPFGQVDSALAREHEGTGLGVPLVKAIIELHGGTLTFDSTPGKGREVTLRFPPERSIRSEAAKTGLRPFPHRIPRLPWSGLQRRGSWSSKDVPPSLPDQVR